MQHLDKADALIQSDPAAAMKELNKYDVSEFTDSATMARWALLYSEALVVNKITVPTDTIVNIAIDYYGTHNMEDQYNHALKLKELLRTSGARNALTEAIYVQKEKEFLIYKERIKREEIIFIALTIILLAVIIIVWQRQRIKLKVLQNENLISEAATLMNNLSQRESQCDNLRGKLRSVLSNRFNTINELCETYYETQGTKLEKKAIIEKVQSQIEGIKSDDGLFAEMEKSVNDCSNGLLNNLRCEYPTIKPDDYRLIVYLACNLSNRSIALLIGESMDVVYKRKSRLKTKISNLNAPHTAQFMTVF